MVVFSCKTCDHSISQAFNGAAARGEAHLARIPDPFEAPRAKTIGSTTNIAIGEAHLALFVMWCPQRARSMFRTVSEIRAGNGRSFIAENASAPVPEAFARSERRGEAVGGSRKHFPIFWAIMPTCSRSIGRSAHLVPPLNSRSAVPPSPLPSRVPLPLHHAPPGRGVGSQPMPRLQARNVRASTSSSRSVRSSSCCFLARCCSARFASDGSA